MTGDTVHMAAARHWQEAVRLADLGAYQAATAHALLSIAATLGGESYAGRRDWNAALAPVDVQPRHGIDLLQSGAPANPGVPSRRTP